MNYDKKKFRVVSNSENGEVTDDLIFEYEQKENVLSCTYSGSRIILGHLIGLVDEEGNIEMRYHQINSKGELMTGTCYSTPELLPNGKLRLYESWEWTSVDGAEGHSILEEV